MAKVLTVAEALESMKGKVNKKGKVVANRFNKKNFNTLMVSLINDPDFRTQVVKVKGNDIDTVEDVMVSNGFRKWCKNLVEKAGVDKAESERVMSPEFQITNVDGLYEFFETALYEYLQAGNSFDFETRKDFKGSLSLKSVDESVKVADAFSPVDRSYLGTFETTKKKHKELAVKSSCPKFLQSRKKVEK